VAEKTKSAKISLVVDAKAELGEGPCWDIHRQMLYWVDIIKHLVHIYDPKTSVDRTIDVGQEVGCVAPRRAGGLLCGFRNGIGILDTESAEYRILLDPENHLPGNRFNDGKCDPAGRFWAGTMAPRVGDAKRKAAGSLYCLFPNMTIRTMVSGVITSNGLAWSPDSNQMYYIDTGLPVVSAFDFDRETGDISNRRTVIEIDPSTGKPDGMTIDEEGMLWVAHFGGGRVTRWDPNEGRLLKTIEVPAPRVTSCAFGGYHLDTLFITTARSGMTEDELKTYPKAGGLFRLNPGVRGTPTAEFNG
jgi:sugar lactone lactonase YvrE